MRTDPAFLTDLQLRGINSAENQRAIYVNRSAQDMVSNPLDLEDLLTQEIPQSGQLMQLLANAVSAADAVDRSENFEDFRRALISVALQVSDRLSPDVDKFLE